MEPKEKLRQTKGADFRVNWVLCFSLSPPHGPATWTASSSRLARVFWQHFSLNWRIEEKTALPPVISNLETLSV